MGKRRCTNTIIDNRQLADDGLPYSNLKIYLNKLIATVWDNDMNMIIYVRMMKMEGYKSYIYRALINLDTTLLNLDTILLNLNTKPNRVVVNRVAYSSEYGSELCP
jgi:hypothetical protein